jgi:ribosomal protein L7Ae-like RNA K-turn-binding protein
MLDRTGRAPGRGVYVCFDARCLRRALKPTRLSFAFKQPIAVPTFETLYLDIAELLHDRLRACFRMARKAGVIVSGYTSLQKAFAQAKVACVVLAEDITTSRAEEYRVWCIRQDIPCITLFSKEELGWLIGRPDRSAVGFTVARFCELLYTTLTSLEKWYFPEPFPVVNSKYPQLSS